MASRSRTLLLVVGAVARFSACPVQLTGTLRVQGPNSDVISAKDSAYSVLNQSLCHVLPSIGSVTCTSANGTQAAITAANFTSYTDVVQNSKSSFSEVQLKICLSAAASREATESDVRALSNSSAIQQKLRELDSGASNVWGAEPVVSVKGAGVSCLQCAHCPQASHALQGDRCSQCHDGFQPASSNLVCKECPVGHAGTQGECKKCKGNDPNPQRTKCDKKRPFWKRDWFVYLIAAIIAVAAIFYAFRKMCRRMANKQSPEPEPVVPATAGKEMVAREMRTKDKEEEEQGVAYGEPPAAAYKL